MSQNLSHLIRYGKPMVKIYCDEKDTTSSGAKFSWDDKISNVSTNEKNYVIYDDYGGTTVSIPTSKAEYELLLLQVSELRKRLEEVEERERTLIKMLMEKLNGADD